MKPAAWPGAELSARLFVWFAGHGATELGEGYLVPADGGLTSDRRKFLQTALSLRDFGKFVRYAKSKHVFAVFDSCFSGTIFKGAREPPPPAITRVTTEPVRQFLSSGDANQSVSDDGRFRRLFLDALAGKRRADSNGDGYLTATELGLFITDKVSNYTNNRQTPKYGKLPDEDYDEGDFVFRVATQRAPATANTAAAPSIDKETLAWQAAEALGTVMGYEAFASVFPDSPLAAMAEAKIAALTPAAKPEPPRRPTYTVTALEQTMVVQGATRLNVRDGPGGTKLDSLRAGAEVEVTGQTTYEGARWYRIALAGGRVGFVFGRYLADKPPTSAQPAVGVFPKPTTPAPQSAGRYEPGDSFKDCPDCPEMVVVPPGKFMMGSSKFEQDWFVEQGGERGRKDAETPRHGVQIHRAFAVGRYEVTRGQFAAFVKVSGHDATGGCWYYDEKWKEDASRAWRNPGYQQTDSHPVVCVSWEDAKAYAAWLAKRTGENYRLLSEAEWEYAARAGTTTMRYWGDDRENAQGCTFANVLDQGSGWAAWAAYSCSDNQEYTAPAGRYRANDFGLYDMLGNVWEWTADCWNDSYQGAYEDGRINTIEKCTGRVQRGGSWFNVPRYLRSAYRSWGGTGDRVYYNGFRMARTLEP